MLYVRPKMNQLIAEIEKPFDGVPIPREVTLHVADAHDGYDYDHDPEHRAKDFIGRWQDVPAEHPVSYTHLTLPTIYSV